MLEDSRGSALLRSENQDRLSILARWSNFAPQNLVGAQRPRIKSIPNVILYWGVASGGGVPGWLSRYSGPSGMAAPRNPCQSALLRSVNQARLDIMAGRRMGWGLSFIDPKSIQLLARRAWAPGFLRLRSAPLCEPSEAWHSGEEAKFRCLEWGRCATAQN